MKKSALLLAALLLLTLCLPTFAEKAGDETFSLRGFTWLMSMEDAKTLSRDVSGLGQMTVTEYNIAFSNVPLAGMEAETMVLQFGNGPYGEGLTDIWYVIMLDEGGWEALYEKAAAIVQKLTEVYGNAIVDEDYDGGLEENLSAIIVDAQDTRIILMISSWGQLSLHYTYVPEIAKQSLSSLYSYPVDMTRYPGNEGL